MKNAITNLKTELTVDHIPGRYKIRIGPNSHNGGFRFSRFVRAIVCTIAVLSLYFSCPHPRLCLPPAQGAALLVPASSLRDFLTLKGAPGRRAEGARVSLGHHWATLRLSPPHPPQAPSRTGSVLPLPRYCFLFVHKVSVIMCVPLNSAYTPLHAFSNCSPTRIYFPPAK